MKRLGSYKWLLAALLVLGTGMLTAFPLWLDAPTRSNPLDPKSPLFQTPVSAAPATTPTNSFTQTPPNTATVTRTQTRTSTPSPTLTATQTPNWDSDDTADNSPAGASTGHPAPSTSLATLAAHDVGDTGDLIDYYVVGPFTNGLPYTIDFTGVAGPGAASLTVEVRNNPADTLVTGPSPSISSSTLNGTYYIVVRATGYVSYQLRYIQGTPPTDTATMTVTLTMTSSPSPSASPTRTVTATFTSAAGSPTFTPTITPSPSITPIGCQTAMVVPTFVMDDAEAGICYSYPYDDGSSPMTTMTQDMAVYHNGAAGYYLGGYTIGTTWGGGFGWEPAGCPGTDARGISPDYFYIWVKTDQNINIYLTLVENKAVLGSANDEHWSSPAIPVSAGNCWQLVEYPMASFILNNYFHVTLGNPPDNGVFDAAVTSLDIQFGVGVSPDNDLPLNFYFDDAGFSAGSQLPAPAPTPTAVPGGVGYTNFESPVSGAYSYTDTPAFSTIAYSHTSSDANSGSKSYKFTVTTDAGGWGAGAGFDRNGNVPVDATGMTKMRFYYKTDQAASLVLSLRESNVAGTDPTNEQWVSSAQPLTAGGWTMAEVPLSDFSTESTFNSHCQPNCATTGDGVLNLNALLGLDFQFVNASPLAGAQIFVDDVTFVP